MGIKITKLTFAKICLLAVAVCFAIYVKYITETDLLYVKYMSGASMTIKILITVCLMIFFCLFYFSINLTHKIKTSKFFNFFVAWASLIFLNVLLLTETNDIKSIIILVLRHALMLYFLFIFFYAIFKYYGDSLQKFFGYIVLGWYIAIALAYSVNFLELGALALMGRSNVLGISYILLYPLPLALCLQNKFFKWFCVILGFIVVLSSVKRGGMIGYALAMFVYYFVHNYYIKRSKHFLRNTILLGILFLIAFIIYDRIVSESIIGKIMDRIGNISQDSGSGRLQIWSGLINKMPDLSFGRILVGHGFLGSTQFIPGKLGAHNDFLESFFDYGLIGLGIYIWFYVIFFRKLRFLIKQKSALAAPFAAGFTVFFALSIYSQIIIYDYYFALYAIIVGSFDGMSHQQTLTEKHINNKNL